MIESLMAECPTVATAVCGMVDCVIDGETGILVRPSDPADLARGINTMLRDRCRARALAKRGRRLMVGRFSLARTCSDLDRLYRTERSASSRRFYNPLVSLARCIVGLPILAWFVVRVAFRDFYLPAQWPTHRVRLQRLFDAALSLAIRWWPRAALPSYPLLRIRWANRRISAGLHLARWRIEIPMYARMYRQRLGGWLITAGHHMARWRIEVPMYAQMYRQQLASWIGSRAPGWGVLSFIQSVMSGHRPIPVRGALLAPSAAEPSARDDLK